MSPLTLPATETDAARICAVTTAVSLMIRLSLAMISPSTSPSIRAGPSKVTLPVIFDPRSRHARPSGPVGALARGADDGALEVIGDAIGAVVEEAGVGPVVLVG